MKHNLAAFGVIVLIIAGVLCWVFKPRQVASPSAKITSASKAGASQFTKPAPPLETGSGYEVPPGGRYEGLSDPRWKWWNMMEKRDSSFEWKMPINFYGRVVDQTNQSIGS